MNTRRVAALTVLVLLLVFGGFGFLVYDQLKPPRVADPAELERELAENKLEAVAAFRDPVPPTDAQVAEFTPVLVKLGQAIHNQNAEEVRRCFNAARFGDECARVGVFEKFGFSRDPLTVRQFHGGMMTGLGTALAQKGDLFSWDKCDLRRVRLSEDGNEAIVIALQHQKINGEKFTNPMRWWLTKKSGTWLIYDMEELATGLRMTSLMASIASPALLQNAPQFREAVQSMNEALVAVAAENFDGADKALGPMRRAENMPKPFLGVRALVEACIAIGREDATKGLTFLDEAEKYNPDMPITHQLRAAAHNMLGEYEKAIVASNKYLDILGADATVLLQKGLAQENLERAEEAAASYRQALDLDPDNVECFNGLRRVLPKERKSELIARLKKRRESTADELRTFAREALTDRDLESLDALIGMMRRQNPDSADALVFATDAALERKQVAAAIKHLKEAFEREGEDRMPTIERIVNTLAWAGHGSQAYAATPVKEQPAIFQSLAEIQIEKLSEADDEGRAKERAQLDQLLEAHRKLHPNDAWLFFYEAQAEETQNNLAPAEAAYLKALAAMPKEKADDRDRVRTQLINVLYRQKRGHEAYTKFGPDSQVFTALAWQFELSKDFAGLKKLNDLHKAKNATDPNLLYWTGTYHWHLAEYAPAIEAYRRYAKTTKDLAEDAVNYRWSVQSRTVRGFVRLKQLSTARAELKAMSPPYDDYLDPLVSAASGEVQKTQELIRVLVEEKKYQLRYLYQDEDLGPLLRSEKMKPIREKYPEPKPDNPLPNGKPIG